MTSVPTRGAPPPVGVPVVLGAPGVYPSAEPPRAPGLEPVRLDETGFVGLAFRGPPHEPVRVDGWSQFVDRFGGPVDVDGPCPGHLPRAVRAFFDQGGRRAWVCRVVPTTPAGDAVAAHALVPWQVAAAGDVEAAEVATPPVLLAADEGAWGGRIRATLGYRTGPPLRGPDGSATVAAAGRGTLGPDEDPDRVLVLDDGPPLPPGSVVLASGTATAPDGSLHRITEETAFATPDGRRLHRVVLDPPLPPDRRGPGGGADVRLVTATLDVVDRDPLVRRAEHLVDLGLLPGHPRFPARELPPDDPRAPGTLLSAESRLVRPGPGWEAGVVPTDGRLEPLVGLAVRGGRDRFSEVGREALFDDGPPDADPLDETGHVGVDRVARVEELGLLCVPDLGWAGTGHLDPTVPDELAELVSRQRRLVAVAHLRRRFVALLDAPRRTPIGALSRWRAEFDSSHAAAYHPWLAVPGEGPLRLAVPVPPSAVAAGIIADREHRLGLARGPANEPAAGVVTAADLVPDAEHDELHRMGVNVFRAERDGFRLTSARTLALDPRYRQLSVRRLMTMLSLTLERRTQWLVFEPSTADLRAALHQTLDQFLRGLFRAGAFAGDTEETSYFVRCDGRLNPPGSLALGRLVAEVGVAPASPLEYLVLRITQDTDAGTRVTPVEGGGLR